MYSQVIALDIITMTLVISRIMGERNVHLPPFVLK